MRHRRFEPVEPRLHRRDVLRLPRRRRLPESLDRLPLWSARRAAPLRFRRRDYLDGTDRPLGDAVARPGRSPHRTSAGRPGPAAHPAAHHWVGLQPALDLLLLRAQRRGVETLVLEVTNTPWNERCWYVVDVDRGPARTGRGSSPRRCTSRRSSTWTSTYRLRCAAPRSGTRGPPRGPRRGDRTVFDADLSLRRIDARRGGRPSPSRCATRCRPGG